MVGLSIGPTGVVTAESLAGIQWPYVCYVKSDVTLNAAPDVCKSIYAMLLAAQTMAAALSFEQLASHAFACLIADANDLGEVRVDAAELAVDLLERRLYECRVGTEQHAAHFFGHR